MQLIEEKIQLKTFFNKLLWFMVSGAFYKSISIIPVKGLKSKLVSILSISYEGYVPVKWFLRNPDWYLYRILLSVKYSIV